MRTSQSNIKTQVRIIGLSWLIAGVMLLIWAGFELWEIGHNIYLGAGSGAFKATLECLAFSVLCILGATGLSQRKRWGRILIILTAIIVFLYAAAYLFMGGFEDTGTTYAAIVTGLFLLSLWTFLVLARRGAEFKRGCTQTPRGPSEET